MKSDEVPCGFEDARPGVVGFAPSAYKWPKKELTYSFAPDGTPTSYFLPSELFAVLDAKFPRDVWQGEYRRALAEWGKVAGLTFAEVSDDGRPSGMTTGTGVVGDIRFYGVKNTAVTWAGVAYFPTGSSLAGDMFLNTRYAWDIVSLRTVVLHEIGHSLGLNHSTTVPSVMKSSFSWGQVTPGLYPDDIAGIQTVYGTLPPPVPPLPVPVAAGDWKPGFVNSPKFNTLPAGVTVVAHANAHSWAANTTDPRGVQNPGTAGRHASCWYAATTLQLNLSLPSEGEREVSLYCVDWDSTARKQTVQLLDAGGAVLDTRAVENFRGGVWLTWKLSGAVRFRVTRIAGSNAVVSAVVVK